MAEAPFPLLTQATLERRLQDADERQLSLGLTDKEWTGLLSEIIEEESAYVARLLRRQELDFADFGSADALIAEYPPVRRGMIRLCRASLHEIAEDGLEKESIGDHTETYSAPGTVRSAVADEITSIDVPSSGDDDPKTAARLL